MEQSDEALCRRVAHRDHDAFEMLVERHQHKAYRLACSILGDESEARDVSQDAFIRLFESAASFDGRSRFSTWFHRILVNLCIDHQRRGRGWRRLLVWTPAKKDADVTEFDPPSPDPEPDQVAISRQSSRRFRDALSRLSPKQRAAVMLQVNEDLSSREIAEVLGCSESTARVHLHRALNELKKIMARG